MRIGVAGAPHSGSGLSAFDSRPDLSGGVAGTFPWKRSMYISMTRQRLLPLVVCYFFVKGIWKPESDMGSPLSWLSSAAVPLSSSSLETGREKLELQVFNT